MKVAVECVERLLNYGPLTSKRLHLGTARLLSSTIISVNSVRMTRRNRARPSGDCVLKLKNG